MDRLKEHVTKYGVRIPIKELTAEHLSNIISLIKKRAKTGITVRSGSCWFNDCDYDEETIFGKDVKKLMNYKAYKREFKRRKRLWLSKNVRNV